MPEPSPAESTRTKFEARKNALEQKLNVIAQSASKPGSANTLK